MFRKLYNSSLSVLVSKSSFIICSLIAANVLTLNDYSIYGLYFSTISMISGVVGQALLNTTNRYYSNNNSLSPLFVLVLSITVIATSVYLYVWARDIFSYIEKYLIISIVFFCLLASYLTGVLYSLGRVKDVSKSYTISSIVLLISPLFAMNLGVFYILVAYLLFFGLASLGMLCFVKNELIFTFSRDDIFYSLVIVRKMTIPAMLASLVFLPVFTYVLLAMHSITNSSEEIAIFTIANQVRMVLSFIPLVLSAFFISKILKGEETYESDWNSTLLMSTIGGGSLILSSGFILKIFNYNISAYSLSVLYFMIGAGYCSVLKSSIARCLIIKESIWLSVISNIIFGILFISIYTILSSNYGIDAFILSLSFLVSQVIHMILSVKFFSKQGYFDINNAFMKSLIGVVIISMLCWISITMWL